MIELVYARAADRVSLVAPCFVGDPPDNCPVPYVFVWGPLPVEEALTAAGCDDVVDLRFHVTVVDKQAPDVLLLAGRVKESLRDVELSIEGWRTFPLQVTGSEPVQTSRRVPVEESNTYPAWVVLHLRFQATKED